MNWIDVRDQLPEAGDVEFIMFSDFKNIQRARVYRMPLYMRELLGYDDILWTDKKNTLNERHITHWRKRNGR